MNNFIAGLGFCIMLCVGGSDGPLFPFVNFAGVVVGTFMMAAGLDRAKS